MKILQISTSDVGSGAANATYRLHQGLLRSGYDSKMFVAESCRLVSDPSVIIFRQPTDLVSRLRCRLRRIQMGRSLAAYNGSRPSSHELFSDDRSPHTTDVINQLPAADIINIHAMFNFIDYRAFFSSPRARIPIVRTLHDMSFFTGGCHFDDGCGNFTNCCGACPQLGSQKAYDLSRAIWLRKRAAFAALKPGRLHLVAPSHWLSKQVKTSALLKEFPVTVIPNGVDTEVFCPRERGIAREFLGISGRARVVLFVAEPITRVMKGFGTLVQALAGLIEMPDLVLVTVGSGKPWAKVPVHHVHLSHISNDRLLSFVYSAADVFVIPSLQDNCPLTALEAMSCGIPIIGSTVGGIPDMVRPGITGQLVPPQDAVALRTAIRDMLEDPAKSSQLAANCRRVAVEEYALEVQTRRYAYLYETLLANH